MKTDNMVEKIMMKDYSHMLSVKAVKKLGEDYGETR